MIWEAGMVNMIVIRSIPVKYVRSPSLTKCTTLQILYKKPLLI